MKRQFFLTDNNGDGQVSVEVNGDIAITLNHPKQRIIDVSKFDEATRDKIALDPGDFKFDKGKVVKRDRPKPPLAHQ